MKRSRNMTMFKSSCFLALTLAMCACLKSPAPTATGPAAASTTPRNDSILGEWFDVDGKSFTLSEENHGEFMLSATEQLKVRAGFFAPKIVPGKMEEGQFTTTYIPM